MCECVCVVFVSLLFGLASLFFTYLYIQNEILWDVGGVSAAAASASILVFFAVQM